MVGGRPRSRPDRRLGEWFPHGGLALAEIERIHAGVAFVYLADRWRRVGRPERAEEVLRAGLTRHPGHHAARVALARLLYARGDEGGAREELERVVEADSNHWSAWVGLARLLGRKGVVEAERAVVRRLMTIRPDDPSLLAWYSRLAAVGPTTPGAGRSSHPHLAVPMARPGGPGVSIHQEAATRVLPALDGGVPDEDMLGVPAIRGGTQPSARLPLPPRPIASVRFEEVDPTLSPAIAEEMAARGELPGALRVLETLLARDPRREQLRRRYLELGGSEGNLPAIEAEDGASLPDAEALEAVLVGALGHRAD